MKMVDAEMRGNLLARLRVMAILQQRIWDEAITIADEILGCELEVVLDQVPDLASALCSEGEYLTEDDLDDFLEYCGRIVAIRQIRIDLAPSFPAE